MQKNNLTKTQVSIKSDTTQSSLTLYYYLTACELCGSDGIYQSFGITVKMFSGEELLDECELDDVVVSQSEVDKLISLLSKNSVTPCTLRDVIEDYLAG